MLTLVLLLVQEPRLPREDLLVHRGGPVRSLEDWGKRRAEILRGMESIMGRMPGAEKRCPLDLKIEKEEDVGTHTRRLVTYASEPGCRVPAWLLVPKGVAKAPAVLALHGT